MRNIYNLFLSILSCSIPCILFGELTTYRCIGLVVSLILMVFFTEYKSSIGKKWPTYVCSVLFGITMSMMGLSILGLTTHGTVFTLSIKFGFVVFIIFALPYNYFLIKYRKNKSEIYISNFQGDTIKLQRDRRINQIIGNIFS